MILKVPQMTQSMGVKIFNIVTYEPKSSDVFFFDNVVWMYIFCPLGNYNKKKQKYFSSFLKGIDSSRGTIFTNSLILSEFTNRYLRLDFALWKTESGNENAEFKKDFIGTQRYQETIRQVIAALRSILSFCEKTPDNFNAIDINNVLTHLEYIDFNDSYFIELATLNNYKFVTDDSDFTVYNNHNLNIYTIVR
jgi:predicted nucleic acid-binding protein